MRVVRLGLGLLLTAGGCVLAPAASAQSVVCCNVPIGVGGKWVGSSRLDNCQEYFNTAPTDVLRRMCEQRQWLACINTARCSELPPEPGKSQDSTSGGASPPSQGKSGGGQAMPPKAGSPPKAGTGGGETSTLREFVLIPGSPNTGTADAPQGAPPKSSTAAASSPSSNPQGLLLPLKSLRLDPAPVTGGHMVQGTVELVQAPGTDGLTVLLESSNQQLAGVPASVTITHGTASAETGSVVKATFRIDTQAVSAFTTVTIKARAGAQSLQSDLRILSPQVEWASFDAPRYCDGNNKGTIHYRLTGPAPSGLKVRASHSLNKTGSPTIEGVPKGNSAGTIRVALRRCVENDGQCHITGSLAVENPNRYSYHWDVTACYKPN